MFTDSTGTDFVLATAGSITLQNAYNNSATPATITLSAAAKKINIRDSIAPATPIFDIQDNTGVTTYFSVESTRSVISTRSAISKHWCGRSIISYPKKTSIGNWECT